MIALVTGGASGLGAEICRVLAPDHTVIVADRAIDGARAIADEIGGVAMEIDLTDSAACDQLVQDIVSEHGGIDVLVNNAGTDVAESIEVLTQADFDRVIAVNLTAPFALARAAFPHMREKGKGGIVNIVSTAAKRVWTGASAYHASKTGLLGLSHAMHVEGRQLGIRVTAVVAGGMRTPFILDRFPETPLENLQEPARVAEVVRFVLRDTGSTMIPEVTVLPDREAAWP